MGSPSKQDEASISHNSTQSHVSLKAWSLSHWRTASSCGSNGRFYLGVELVDQVLCLAPPKKNERINIHHGPKSSPQFTATQGWPPCQTLHRKLFSEPPRRPAPPRLSERTSGARRTGGRTRAPALAAAPFLGPPKSRRFGGNFSKLTPWDLGGCHWGSRSKRKSTNQPKGL